MRKRTLAYPPAKRGNVIVEYHGVEVPDPFRWLESLDSRETQAWITAQSELTRDYLGGLPEREAIAQRLRELWNFERWSAPARCGAYWFYTHNDGLQNHAAVCITSDPDEDGRILLDPNVLSEDGTIGLREWVASTDGRFLAYALSDGGADWLVWRVRDVETGTDLTDFIQWSKGGGVAWLADSSGFYYTCYEPPANGDILKAPNRKEKLCLHRLGRPQSEDRVVYTRDDEPYWLLSKAVTEDGKYLVIHANRGADARNILLVQDLSLNEDDGLPLRYIVERPAAVYTFIKNIGSTLYVMTDEGAPRYKIVAVDLAKPESESWQTVVPERSETLSAVTLVGGQLLAQYVRDAHSFVVRFALDGKYLGELCLPGMGEAEGFQGQFEDPITYYTYSDFSSPPRVYRLDMATGESSLCKSPRIEGFKAEEYQTRQVFYPSKDGTQVPLYIVARAGVSLDGRNPVILTGYGGFNLSRMPTFSAAVAYWLELGGVYAVANIRGGGEYGRAWHEDGMKTRKQNVFDDFTAAAEFLIAGGWTSPERLTIRGGSNGGLLIGATEVQRPDLFAAAVLKVGVLDMLRFREFTVGRAWESEYGSVADADEFKALLAYSPLHNVRTGVDYPATLVMTGDHDDRVFPAHSLKFAAALQSASPNGRPVLLRIERRAGHGDGAPISMLIEETADVYAFILNAIA